MTTLTAGTYIQNLVGHWYCVVEAPTAYGPIRVQPLTRVGTDLRPLGAPCWAYQSEFTREGA